MSVDYLHAIAGDRPIVDLDYNNRVDPDPRIKATLIRLNSCLGFYARLQS